MEAEETPIKAAKRETFEETNLLVDDLEKVSEAFFYSKNKWWDEWSLFHDSANWGKEMLDLSLEKKLWSYKVYFFKAKSYSGKPMVVGKEKSIIKEIKFMSKEEISKIAYDEGVKYFFEKLND